MNEKILDNAIKMACQQFGVLDQGFLCQSVSALEFKTPIVVQPTATMREVVTKLKNARIGCCVVVDTSGKLVGLISERDLVMKVPLIDQGNAWASEPVATYMTKNVVFENPQATIAYALNLMSHGGFRHLPIVDEEGRPIGLISIKDIVDRIVHLMVQDLEKFGTAF